MNFPPLKNVDFAPFLNVVNQVKGHLTQAIGSITDPEVRDMFSGLLGEMESKQAQLEVEAPQWKAKAEARYAGIINKFKEADTKKEALLSQLKELKAEIGVKIQLAKAKAAEAKLKPKRAALRPRIGKLKKNKPLKLTPGDTLRDWLLPKAAPKIPPIPHTHGNIWDDWGQVHSDSKPQKSDTETGTSFDEGSDED